MPPTSATEFFGPGRTLICTWAEGISVLNRSCTVSRARSGAMPAIGIWPT